MSARLLKDFARTSRKVSTRHNKWRIWIAFGDSEGRQLLSDTEAYMMVYVRLLAIEREAIHPFITSTSLPRRSTAV